VALASFQLKAAYALGSTCAVQHGKLTRHCSCSVYSGVLSIIF